ncbi:SRPBCC family protein [Rhodococcus gannanensis]|jgi:hypothetical protein|uniref:SRPBCC family protein n=1 Tax=Rhodococcus gannanensis TaxID=1960308 RepID=A0ABW4P044_9NOCA
MADSTFLVERSTTIGAGPEVVFDLIDDFRRWTEWSPWEGVDPNLNRTYSGADRGVGASYAWTGNRKAGAGSMTITESVPGRKVTLDLAFLKPFKATNVTTFLIEPGADGTTVRWQMAGTRSGLMKVFGLVMNMDKIVGKDFEKGLASMKEVAEAA